LRGGDCRGPRAALGGRAGSRRDGRDLRRLSLRRRGSPRGPRALPRLVTAARTVFEAFAATARAAPDHAVVCAPPSPGRGHHPGGVEYTYANASAEIHAVRDRYAAAGYGHGHRVALLLENRPEFLFHYLALNALGTGIVPVNPDYRHDELAYQMEHSEADLAV